MALINCPECGQQISDKAQSCPVCGHPIGGAQSYTNSVAPSTQFVDQQPVQPTQQIRPYDPKPKNSILSILALIFSLFGCTAIVGLILAIVDLTQKNDKKKTGSIAALVICGIWVVMALIVSCIGSSSTSKPTTTQQTQVSESDASQQSEEVATQSEEEQKVEEPAPTDREEFIASCQEIPYKTLARNPEDYIGAHIVLTVKVSQIMQGGAFDNNQYYHVYANDEYGFWSGDEYFMYDKRSDDNTRILTDDILTVYAEFSGLETVERAFTKTTEEIPSITAMYIDIQDESTYEGSAGVASDDDTVVDDGLTTGQRNAIASAKSYLQYSVFSRDGLIHQLEYEQYSTEDATFAADNCGADWNEQAALSAKSYLQYSSFSRDGLIDQLKFDGFTEEQAVYGVESNGY